MINRILFAASIHRIISVLKYSYIINHFIYEKVWRRKFTLIWKLSMLLAEIEKTDKALKNKFAAIDEIYINGLNAINP